MQNNQAEDIQFFNINLSYLYRKKVRDEIRKQRNTTISSENDFKKI